MGRALLLLGTLAAGCVATEPDVTGMEPYQRYLGALELGRENDSADVPVLIALLNDPDPLARDGAVVGIGRTGRRELTPHIVEMTYERVEKGGKDPRDFRMLRADACRALALLRDPRAVPALIGAMRGDTAVEVRRTAALALEAFADRPEVLAALVDAVGDRSAAVAYNAYGVLGRVAGRTDIPRDAGAWREWLKSRGQ